MQGAPRQEAGSGFSRATLQQWPLQARPQPGWRLRCELPVSLNANGLMSDDALRQIVVLKSLRRQYRGRGLQVDLRVMSPDARLFTTTAFRNAMTDLDLNGIAVTHSTGNAAERIALVARNGSVTERWDGFAGPVKLGLALRKSLGVPAYSQMAIESGNENE